MGTTPTLGPVSFSGFEVPERIAFGGKQKLVVHSMPGGGRVVDTMGPDDAPIRWSGVFSGETAGERVRLLERLRRGGAPLLLTWDGWRFTVIIQDFEAEVTKSSWIPYSIDLCVAPSASEVTSDWLLSAVAPVVAVSLGAAALGQGIQDAGAALSGGSLASVVAASGQLAHYVTARAYGGLLP